MRKVIVVTLLAIALVFACDQNNPVEASYYPAHVVNIRTYLSLREEPSTYSRELARIPNGAYIDIIIAEDEQGRFLPFISNGCYYVEYNGMAGWAHSNYIHIDH